MIIDTCIVENRTRLQTKTAVSNQNKMFDTCYDTVFVSALPSLILFDRNDRTDECFGMYLLSTFAHSHHTLLGLYWSDMLLSKQRYTYNSNKQNCFSKGTKSRRNPNRLSANNTVDTECNKDYMIRLEKYMFSFSIDVSVYEKICNHVPMDTRTISL